MAGINRRQGRCWRFGSAVLDEASWILVVDDRRVAIEAKPMELLHELLVRAGQVVTKDELLDAVWPCVSVVEASIPTAVLKLRRALGDDSRDRAIIETVTGIGYRLAVPVAVEQPDLPPGPPALAGQQVTADELPDVQASGRRWPLTAGGLALLAAAGALAVARMQYAPVATAARPFTQRDAGNALRKLDVRRIEELIAAGWSPNTPFDKEGDGALNYALNICEWDPGHDQQKLMLVARTLLDGGAKLDARNSFGDTAYSIAKANRYCGPDHPVTRMLHTLCYAGYKPLGDKCLATYERPPL